MPPPRDRTTMNDEIDEVRQVRFGYVDTSIGQIHYAEAGVGESILCLHQTPRSWDEYRELMDLLNPHVRVIAMDTPGMGRSASPAGEASIESYSGAAAELVSKLGLDHVTVIGHHTGGVIGIDLAARYPELVTRLVVSSTPWVDEQGREARRHRAPIDRAEKHLDGSHLTELWARRQAFYPPDRSDVLERYVGDLIASRDPEEGHLAVARYRMEDVIDRIVIPTMCIGATDDPYAFPELGPLSQRIPQARVELIEGGTVGLLEAKAAEYAALVLDFLATS
ncbi:MAG: pimeloyl-ACP methyl ester carboxylesterase [Candidatus Azotimanducaceae bacterium]|jgi:pimeloyl-ACP methyl ester carboxylesterase